MNSNSRHRKPKRLNLLVLAAFAGILACAAMIVGLSAVPDAGSPGLGVPPERGAAAKAITLGRALFLDPASGSGLRAALETPGSRVSRSLLGAASSPRTVSSIATFLGRVGRRDALRALAPLLARPEEAVQAAAQDAMLAILRRHPGARTWAVVGSLTTDCGLPLAVRARLVQILASVEDPRARRCLENLLGEDAGVDLTLLPALGAAVAAGGQDEASALSDRVRGFLDSGDPALRRESALFLGRARDLEALPALVEILDDEHQGVRDNAHWALRDMTGLRLPGSRERWSAWLRDEAAFAAAQGPAILDSLQSDDEARIAEALREVSEHPLLRPEAESHLLALLSDDRSGIRDAAGHALQRLRSPNTALIDSASVK